MGAKNKNQTFKRLSINLTPELDRVVLDLRKTEEYCRCSYVEIIRILMTEGAKALAEHHHGSDAKREPEAPVSPPALAAQDSA